MPREQVVVRPPVEADVPVLLLMWDELRHASSRGGSLAPPPTEGRLLERLARVEQDPKSRVVVAELGGEVVGVALIAARPFGPFHGETAVQIDYLHVRSGSSRHGVGRALVAAAADFAEDMGAEHVGVNVFPQLREANRFYARLGFSPLVVRRVTTVASLRRRLDPQPRRRSRAGVLARRRSEVRARTLG